MPSGYCTRLECSDTSARFRNVAGHSDLVHKHLANLYDLPKDCVISEKSLATEGSIFKAKVMTGNATAPPPSDVAPATMEPKIMVMVMR